MGLMQICLLDTNLRQCNISVCHDSCPSSSTQQWDGSTLNFALLCPRIELRYYITPRLPRPRSLVLHIVVVSLLQATSSSYVCQLFARLGCFKFDDFNKFIHGTGTQRYS
eukprot:6180363-Pleurochrysis_carterae.AAC.1